MAAALALLAAVLFALAATLQQRGEFVLARRGEPVRGVRDVLRLFVVPVWLLGTSVLLLSFVPQAAALDRGRIVVVQPLLVTSIVWALPLGYWLTHQTVVRRQVAGAGVVIAGLALFVLVGDPDTGVDNASTARLLLAAAIVSALVLALLAKLQTKTSPAIRAAVLGVCAGLWFGLSATFTKPVVEELHVSIADTAVDWRTWALLGFGAGAFFLHQLALATGQLAPAVATVSVTNPILSVVLGIVLYEERLTRPFWHVVVGVAALLAALWGVVMITLANRTTPMPGDVEPQPRAPPDPAVA
jgi:drug/metabolite transporter (DMT)-like permease